MVGPPPVGRAFAVDYGVVVDVVTGVGEATVLHLDEFGWPASELLVAILFDEKCLDLADMFNIHRFIIYSLRSVFSSVSNTDSDTNSNSDSDSDINSNSLSNFNNNSSNSKSEATAKVRAASEAKAEHHQYQQQKQH
jgi:hypothetical protein